MTKSKGSFGRLRAHMHDCVSCQTRFLCFCTDPTDVKNKDIRRICKSCSEVQKKERR